MPATKKNGTVSPPPRERLPRKRRTLGEHDIAIRAYELFIQRGGEHGHDLEDWLLATRELSSDR